MNQRNIFGTVLVSLLASGCSSVDQVPLVYVSTAKVGVNVETGSAETPGASLLIGVDLTDAAYVPVAVARRCDTANAELFEACLDDNLRIMTIWGSSKDVSETERARIAELRNQLEAQKSQLNTLDRAYEAALEQERQASTVQARSEAAREAVEALEVAEHEWLQNPDTGEQPFPRAAELATERDAVNENAATLLRTAQSNREDQRRALDEARNSLWSLLGQVERFIPSAARGTSIDQKDALSVFGSFNGDIGAKTDEGVSSSVKLGKTFSTGVAAQHLTKGIGEAQGVGATTECYAAAKALYAELNEQQQSKVIPSELLAACRHRHE